CPRRVRSVAPWTPVSGGAGERGGRGAASGRGEGPSLSVSGAGEGAPPLRDEGAGLTERGCRRTVSSGSEKPSSLWEGRKGRVSSSVPEGGPVGVSPW